MGNTDRSGYLLHKNENADIKDVHDMGMTFRKAALTECGWRNTMKTSPPLLSLT